MTKRKNRTYSDEFKKEAVALVTEQGYTVSEAATSLGITAKLLYNWKAKFARAQLGEGLNEDERSELKRLRREVKTLKIEREILKKVSAFFAKEMK
jgi:transposase